MARIYFSAIVSDIRGRLGGTVYSMCRGVHYIKEYQPDVNQPNTSRQQTIKGNFSYVSGKWYPLPFTYKQMWRQYASLSGGHLNGYNMFLRHNLRLLAADIPEFEVMLFPPQTIVPVDFPRSVSVVSDDSVSNTFSWDQPQTTHEYIQLYFNLEWNYSAGFNTHWSSVETVRSDAGSITHVHSYPPGTVMYYKARSICNLGKVSPYTHSLTLSVP